LIRTDTERWQYPELKDNPARTRTWQRVRTTEAQQQRRAMKNALQGAQKALRQLKQDNPGIDYSGALRQCKERIAALSEVRS
jgi:hypothetical protein